MQAAHPPHIDGFIPVVSRRNRPCFVLSSSPPLCRCARRDGAMAVLRARNFSLARKSLEKWLQDHDAGERGFWRAGKAAGRQAARVTFFPSCHIVEQPHVKNK